MAYFNLIKTFSLVFIMSLGFSSMAQDIILKQDGAEIKAKVLEITDQHIKYKDFDFQNEPIRNINIPDVFMITYENGQKEIFDEQASTEKIHTVSSSDLKREFDLIGSNDQAMLIFFRENNFPEYYHRFASAYRQRNTGQALLGTGIGLTVLGIVTEILGAINNVNSNPYYTSDADLAYTIVGYSLVVIGEGLIIASIPVSITAGARKREIKNDFAQEHFGIEGYTYQPKLNFGSTSNGVGLIFSF
jgi:hypothetical protein